jgi:hypothetical protein
VGVHLSAGTFGVAFLLGAAFVALWLHVRWPSLMPSRWPRVLAHVAIAIAAAHLAPSVIGYLASLESVPAVFTAVFGVALPLLTYNLLVALWVMASLLAASRGRF